MKSLVLLLLVSLPCYLSTRLDGDWWKRAEIYEIPIWLFRDSDGDGIGDIEGVTSKLDYFKELGIGTIKLSPIFSSAYDISPTYEINDFQKIHLTLGQMKDFDKLMKEAQTKGIKVILDFVINHCSTSHEWFKKSQRRIDPYTDYFIWTNQSIYSTDYWQWDRIRKQYFYHAYEIPSADLNLRNEAVKNEVKNLMKFWFDKGVSGLNLLSANVYMEFFAKEDDPEYIDITSNHPDSYEFVHELREYTDSYNKENGGYERILIVDEEPIEKYTDLHGNSTFPIAHVVSKNIFQYFGTWLNYFVAPIFNDLVTQATNGNENGPKLIISENADEGSHRLANRFYNQQLIDVWLTSIFMLPVAIHLYYGQEIGQADFWSPYGGLQISQRPFRSAMQWDNSLLAGFTSSEFTLMPPNTDYSKNNVETMKYTERSRYNLIKELLKLRKTETVKNGDVKTHVISMWIYAFTRSYQGKETYIVILNLENKCNIITLNNLFGNLPEEVRVVVSSPNAIHLKGNSLKTSIPISLSATSSIVVTVE